MDWHKMFDMGWNVIVIIGLDIHVHHRMNWNNFWQLMILWLFHDQAIFVPILDEQKPRKPKISNSKHTNKKTKMVSMGNMLAKSC